MSTPVEARIFAARHALEQGRLAEAEAIARAVAAQHPASVEAIEVLFVAARTLGRVDEAEAHLRRAIAIDPARRWPYGDLARLLLEAGRSGEAEIVMRQALKADPGNADALMLLAGAELQRGLLIEAEIHVLAAIARVGRHPELLVVLGKTLAQQSRLDEARVVLAEAAAAAPSLEACAVLADLEERAGDSAAASQWLDRAETIAQARGTDVVLQRAVLLDRSGKPDQALALLEGHAQISGAAMLQRGRLHDKLGRHDQAWDDWIEAKAALGKAHGRSYAAAEIEREAQALKAFAQQVDWASQQRQASDLATRPLFILGFPRSGTTLVEQILASHSQVLAGGELPFGRELRDLAAFRLGGNERFLTWLEQGGPDSPELVAQLRAHYLMRARQYRLVDRRGLWFTDKMPLNDLWLPLIRLALPEARVIQMVRHPLDVLTSVMSHDMTHGYNCGYRLEDAARHMLLTHRQIESYAKAGLRVDSTVSYEQLIADQEQKTRSLMAVLGLDLEPGQLEFHRSGRVAPTPSYAQVQEPLNARSVKRWRSYAHGLKPAIDQLGTLIDELGYDLT